VVKSGVPVFPVASWVNVVNGTSLANRKHTEAHHHHHHYHHHHHHHHIIIIILKQKVMKG